MTTPERFQIRFEIDVQQTPARRVAVVTERAHESTMSEVIPRQIMTVGGYLKEIGSRPLGPPFCVCPHGL